MATASDIPYVSNLEMEEDLFCYICHNLLREPKDLDCQHVYCLRCLQNWLGKIDCPQCRHITILPQGGPAYLKTNLRLKTMVEKYADPIEKQKNGPKCSNHIGEHQHLFCLTCSSTVCHKCLVLKHPRPQHDIKEIKVITQTKKAQIKIKMDHVLEGVKISKEDERKLNDAEIKLKAVTEKAMKDIKKHGQEVMAKVEAERVEMIKGLKTTHQQHMKILQEKQNHTKERLMQLQNVHSATQNVVDTAADHVYLTQYASLVKSIDYLFVANYEISASNCDSLSVNPSVPFTNDSQWFGGAVLYGNIICELKLVHEFGNFQATMGIAVNQAGLLAVVDWRRQGSKLVHVFQRENSEFKSQCFLGSSSDRHLHETLLSQVESNRVAVTSKGEFCITDRAGSLGGGLVKIFSPSGRYERSLKSDADGPIATTPDGAIITNNWCTRTITVHTSAGESYEVLKTLKVIKEIENIASNGKQIVYTTGNESDDCNERKVCAIDFETGQAVWSFDMLFAAAICYEHNSNTLLIAGNATGRGEHVIEQYCSTTGRLVSRFATGLYNPMAMTVTHDNKLLVADLKTVKVYEIHFNKTI